MSFTPKVWRDLPNTSTPLTAAAMIDLETRLSAYTDTVASGISVFGRHGAVVALSGDYTAAQVTNAADTSSSSVQTFTSGLAAPEFTASGLTGATAPSRYAGATVSGYPVSGTFLTGDFTIDQTGSVWICTAGGTPGTWIQSSGGTVISLFGRSGAVTAQSGDYTAAQVTNAADKSSGSTQAFTAGLSAPSSAITGITGATQASRYVGATLSGAPVSGTFAIGDAVVDQTGKTWICTTAGTPGLWTQANTTAAAYQATGLTGATAASRYAGATTLGAPASGTFLTGDYVLDQTGSIWICTAGGSPGTWIQGGGGGGSAPTVVWITGGVVKMQLAGATSAAATYAGLGAAVNAAITALGAAGGTIVVSAGTYAMDTPILLPISITGQLRISLADGAVVQLNQTCRRYIDIVATADYQTFQNITIEGGVVDASGLSGMSAANLQSNLCRNSVIGTYHDGVYTGAASQRLNIKNLVIRDIRIDNLPQLAVTTTTGGFTLPQATIALTSTAGLRTSGQVKLTHLPNDPEIITYTGISGNSLTGCTGGTGTYTAGDWVSDFADAQSTRGVFLNTHHLATGEGTQSIIQDVVVERVVVNGGAYGIEIVGTVPGDTSTYNGTNILIDRVRISSCRHIITTKPQAGMATTHFFLGSAAMVSNCIVEKCYGRNSGDDGVEIDNCRQTVVRDCTIENCYGTNNLYVNFNTPDDGGRGDITFERCTSIRTLAVAKGMGWKVHQRSTAVHLGTVRIVDCTEVRNSAAVPTTNSDDLCIMADGDDFEAVEIDNLRVYHSGITASSGSYTGYVIRISNVYTRGKVSIRDCFIRVAGNTTGATSQWYFVALQGNVDFNIDGLDCEEAITGASSTGTTFIAVGAPSNGHAAAGTIRRVVPRGAIASSPRPIVIGASGNNALALSRRVLIEDCDFSSLPTASSLTEFPISGNANAAFIDIKNHKWYSIPQAGNVVDPGSAVSYQNLLAYPIMMYLYGGGVTKVEHSYNGSTLTQIATTTPLGVRLDSGDFLRVTWSGSAPTWHYIPIQH